MTEYVNTPDQKLMIPISYEFHSSCELTLFYTHSNTSSPRSKQRRSNLLQLLLTEHCLVCTCLTPNAINFENFSIFDGDITAVISDSSLHFLSVNYLFVKTT